MSDMPCFHHLPSVDRLVHWPSVAPLLADYGRTAVLAATRDLLDTLRQSTPQPEANPSPFTEAALSAQLAERLARCHAARLKRVFNLTGTVLHTNLGRAPLPEAAVEAVVMAARFPCALEYDLASGGRGDRDAVVEGWLQELTGAQAATVVNNLSLIHI